MVGCVFLGLRRCKERILAAPLPDRVLALGRCGLAEQGLHHRLMVAYTRSGWGAGVWPGFLG